MAHAGQRHQNHRKETYFSNMNTTNTTRVPGTILSQVLMLSSLVARPERNVNSALTRQVILYCLDQ